ncbi:MAG: FHA domain-containing protein [Eubacterium sp.]|nr:FHA domain-containing protein [Eubacterium sp.]
MANRTKSGIRLLLAVCSLCIGMAVPAKKAAKVYATGIPVPQETGTVDTNAESVPEAGSTHSVRAQAGIIEVYSGFVDPKGKFWKMKSGSGFLIANKESATYMITNSSSVSNTPNQIKKYCKKNGINTENMQLTNTVRVVITGDVMAEAEIVVKSAEKDYCVLSAANVVSQKESLKLGDSAGIAANGLVYAYGFPQQEEGQEPAMEYSEMDVRSVQGAITQTDASMENGVYIAHSAPMAQVYAGGPLLDADGYVIGLNCKQSPEEDTGISYALPINEISAVLDNFSIYYGSRAIDEAQLALAAVYQECTQLQAEGGYQKASMEVLEQAVAAAQEVMKLEEPHVAELSNAAQMLVTARDGLVPKTETITILILVFGALDILLFFWMLVLAVKNAQEKREMERLRMQGQPLAQGRGYAGQPYPQDAAFSGKNQPVHDVYARQQESGMQRRPAAPPAGRRLKLLRQKTGQTAVLNKNQFIIGKSQSLADFCIMDNQTISRKHAMLYEDNGVWYVDDLSSLNGTSVNGVKVVPGQPARLRSGDKISLSDETFLVQD